MNTVLLVPSVTALSPTEAWPNADFMYWAESPVEYDWPQFVFPQLTE